MPFVDKLRSASREAALRKAEEEALRKEKQLRQEQEANRKSANAKRQRRASQGAERKALREVAPILQSAVEYAAQGGKALDVYVELTEGGVDLLEDLGFLLEESEEGGAATLAEHLPDLARRLAGLAWWRTIVVPRWAENHSDRASKILALLETDVTSDSFQDLLNELRAASLQVAMNRFFGKKYEIDWRQVQPSEERDLKRVFFEMTNAFSAARRLSWEDAWQENHRAFAIKIPPVFLAECLRRMSDSNGVRELDKKLERAAQEGRDSIDVLYVSDDDGRLSLANGRTLELDESELQALLTVRGMSVQVDRKVKAPQKCFRVKW